VEPGLATIVGVIAVATTVIAVLLGYLSERAPLGAAMLGVFAAVAGSLCLLGTWLGGKLLKDWIGLLVAILLVTLLAYKIGNSFGKKRGAAFVPALWLGYCASCAIGAWAGGWLGLLVITLPSLIVFWGGLLAVSRFLLPLPDNSQWGTAFRSLVTFALGTNYPYLVLEDRELAPRVAGNPYGQFFAGPGIVLTDPAHAPIIWSGLEFKRIGNPGLTFTGKFETIFQTVDLRPQLRAFHVEAITKDGIRIRVLTFFPFKLNAEGQEPALGASFPADESSIYSAVQRQPVEQEKRRSWEDLVPIVATRLLRRIIGQYKFDELCEPFDPAKDPRLTIREELLKQVRSEFRDSGIEIIGGGLSNLEPVDSSVLEERTEAWRAEWQRKILNTLGEGEANAIWELERAHVQAQADLIAAVRHIVEHRPGINPQVLTNMAALRFVEALEEMACSPGIREAAPNQTAETIEYLRRSMGSEKI
jgi:regulator of protease activity HflC (stomatin/prohibitin superfamily)